MGRNYTQDDFETSSCIGKTIGYVCCSFHRLFVLYYIWSTRFHGNYHITSYNPDGFTELVRFSVQPVQRDGIGFLFHDNVLEATCRKRLMASKTQGHCKPSTLLHAHTKGKTSSHHFLNSITTVYIKWTEWEICPQLEVGNLRFQALHSGKQLWTKGTMFTR